MRRTLVICICSAVFCLTAASQTKPAEYHSASDLKQHFEKLTADARKKNTDSTGADLGAYGNHALKLSYRRSTGPAEVHLHVADIMFVTGGEATIVTGGKLVEAKNENENDIKGKSIDGGKRQVLSQGDVIHIPAGTPHQLILDQGKAFQAVVIKVND